MKKPRHPTRRIAVRLAVCLLFGAVATVVVAWERVLWPSGWPGPLGHPRPGPVDAEHSDWPVAVPDSWPRPQRFVGYEAAGLHYGDWVATDEGDVFAATQSTTGWPFPCLSAAFFYETRSVSQPIPAHSIWWNGLTTPFVFMNARPDESRFLPVRPYWPAFFADSVVFAAPVAVLWLGIPAVRRFRRRRRGLCVVCGYDLRGLAACPECGSVPRP